MREKIKISTASLGIITLTQQHKGKCPLCFATQKGDSLLGTSFLIFGGIYGN